MTRNTASAGEVLNDDFIFVWNKLCGPFVVRLKWEKKMTDSSIVINEEVAQSERRRRRGCWLRSMNQSYKAETMTGTELCGGLHIKTQNAVCVDWSSDWKDMRTVCHDLSIGQLSQGMCKSFIAFIAGKLWLTTCGSCGLVMVDLETARNEQRKREVLGLFEMMILQILQ